MRIRGTRVSVCLVCVSCARICSLGFFLVGVGAWVFLVENRDASSVEANTLSGSRSTPLSVWLACYRPFFWCALLFCRGVWGWWCVWWVVCDLYSGCEHLYFLVVWFCLVLLGIRWMPWHQELMKDVAACDMPRGVGERALIRGCPNGGT